MPKGEKWKRHPYFPCTAEAFISQGPASCRSGGGGGAAVPALFIINKPNTHTHTHTHRHTAEQAPADVGTHRREHHSETMVRLSRNGALV